MERGALALASSAPCPSPTLEPPSLTLSKRAEDKIGHDDEYNWVTGPRSIYAKVTLSICSHDQFVFESRAQWPEENYDHWVVDGILDALFGWDHKPMLAGRFVLLEIGWHPVNSAPIAYYRAAKTAVRSALLGAQEGPT